MREVSPSVASVAAQRRTRTDFVLAPAVNSDCQTVLGVAKAAAETRGNPRSHVPSGIEKEVDYSSGPVGFFEVCFCVSAGTPPSSWLSLRNSGICLSQA